MVEYTDGEGDRSLRKVKPTGLIFADGPRTPDNTYLHAHCTVARGTRSFRFDRVQGLSDPKTGEVFAPADWIATRALGEGKPFAWFDDEADTNLAPALDAMPSRRLVMVRAVLIAVVLGYAIGRLRIIHGLLRMAGQHWGAWL